MLQNARKKENEFNPSLSLRRDIEVRNKFFVAQSRNRIKKRFVEKLIEVG